MSRQITSQIERRVDHDGKSLLGRVDADECDDALSFESTEGGRFDALQITTNMLN